jgi:hypothetical protein
MLPPSSWQRQRLLGCCRRLYRPTSVHIAISQDYNMGFIESDATYK